MTQNEPLLQEIEEFLEQSNVYAYRCSNLDERSRLYDILTRLREFKASVDVEMLDEALDYRLIEIQNYDVDQYDMQRWFKSASKLREIVGK